MSHISHRRTVTNQDFDDSRDGDDDDVPSVSKAGCSTEGSSATCLSTTDVMSSEVSYFLIPSICSYLVATIQQHMICLFKGGQSASFVKSTDRRPRSKASKKHKADDDVSTRNNMPKRMSKTA